MERYFKHMSEESSRCYTKCINEILLNIYAVKAGYAEKYLLEIYDERDHKVWKIILPTMIALMERKLANAKPQQDGQD